MYVYVLFVGGLLYGSAAFAGSRMLLLAGIVVALWLAVLGGRSAWRSIARAAHR